MERTLQSPGEADRPPITVVGTARDAGEAVKLARQLKPDVVLMDLRMPGPDPFEAIAKLVNGIAPPKVISLTVAADDETVSAALRAGSNGYILKEKAPEELVMAIRTVVEGHSMLSPAITTGVINRSVASSDPASVVQARIRMATLSGREKKIAQAVAEGLSNREIAELFFLSDSTIKTHLASIQAKLDATNRTQIAVVVTRATLRE